MAWTRRSFLQVGVFGAALLAVGGTGLALRPGVLRPPRRALRALDATAFSVLAAVAERVAPGSPGGAPFPPASELLVAEKIDELLSTSDPAMTTELTQALLLLENALAGLVLDGRPRAFTACTPGEQDAVLEGWRTSRLHVRRQVYKALRGLCASAYYGSPEVYAAVGYPGPPDFSGVGG
jgi:hypothetical protein